MPTKSKPTSRTKSGSKPKSKISNKLIAAIIIGIVAIAGIAIVSSSFAKGYRSCKTTYTPWRPTGYSYTIINGKRYLKKPSYTRTRYVSCPLQRQRVYLEYRK